MAQQPDLYKVLGVDKKASADEIKKAHRKLVRQYHPDRNPGDAKAEERFKEIQAAYDILGDPDKRKKYDREGLNPFTAGGGASGGGFDTGSFSDILSNLFGGGTAGGRSQPRGPRAEKGRDLEAEVSLSFTQAIEGAQVSLQVPVSQ